MSRSPALALALVVLTAAAAGCGAARYHTAAVVAPAAAAGPVPLERSVFARDPNGQLSEDDLQRILTAPLELDLPARIGVLPIVEATDWHGPGPSYDMAPTAMSKLVASLRGTEPFTLVTEMMPIPSGALGMEALREMAARYQLRYILLYREHVRQRTRANGWAVGYATLIGALFLPGKTLHVDGYLEASLFDVKTGLLLFTVRRRVTATRDANVWHTGDKLELLQAGLAAKAAPELAKDVRQGVHRYVEAAQVENKRRVAHQHQETTGTGAVAAQ